MAPRTCHQVYFGPASTTEVTSFPLDARIVSAFCVDDLKVAVDISLWVTVTRLVER